MSFLTTTKVKKVADSTVASWLSCTPAYRSSLARTSMSSWHVSWKFWVYLIRILLIELRGKNFSLVSKTLELDEIPLIQLTYQMLLVPLDHSSMGKVNDDDHHLVPSLQFSKAKTSFLSISSRNVSPGIPIADLSPNPLCATHGYCRVNVDMRLHHLSLSLIVELQTSRPAIQRQLGRPLLQARRRRTIRNS